MLSVAQIGIIVYSIVLQGTLAQVLSGLKETKASENERQEKEGQRHLFDWVSENWVEEVFPRSQRAAYKIYDRHFMDVMLLRIVGLQGKQP